MYNPPTEFDSLIPMKRLALLFLLAVGCVLPAHARRRDPFKHPSRASRKAAKKQQKASNKYAKQQQKAMKKVAKAQRKALKNSRKRSLR
jgi:hypothetical protein